MNILDLLHAIDGKPRAGCIFDGSCPVCNGPLLLTFVDRPAARIDCAAGCQPQTVICAAIALRRKELSRFSKREEVLREHKPVAGKPVRAVRARPALDVASDAIIEVLAADELTAAELVAVIHKRAIATKTFERARNRLRHDGRIVRLGGGVAGAVRWRSAHKDDGTGR